MALRLPQVLLMMAVVLAAGVASVLLLESRSGGASVPGVVLVDAPWMQARDLVALSGRCTELPGRPPEVVVRAVYADPEVLAPFGLELMQKLVGRGDVTALFTANPGLDRAAATQQEVWRIVLDAFPTVAGGSSGQRLVQEAAGFVRAQTGTRAFLAALAPDPQDGQQAPPDLLVLVEALAGLPSYRRSSLVVLGARSPKGTRAVLRVDVGPWGARSRPSLGDLLEARW